MSSLRIINVTCTRGNNITNEKLSPGKIISTFIRKDRDKFKISELNPLNCGIANLKDC